jgi:TRAP-type mannitol/chloroaromatic compound transport system substrate-binding protein
MKRRDVLAGAGLAVGATFSFPAPVVAQGIRHLTMVTDYPDGPGMLSSAQRLAQTIGDASGGRIRIEVSPSGAVVRPLETFEAVQSGVADMFGSHIGYFERKSPAFHFYSGVPFGLTANELFAWVRFGGGQELWDDLGGQFNIKPLLCCSTGTQMGGWFLSEITSTEGFKGLRYRMAGLGAEIYRQLGATVVLVPGADIVQSLRSGAIDACEWVGPWLDTAMGLHQAASFYYYPGWHEPGTALALGINNRVWESFSDGDQRLIEAAAASEYTVSLAEFNTNNALALRRLREDGTVTIRKFDNAMLQAFAEISRDVVAKAGSDDDRARKIYRSYLGFRTLIAESSGIAEGAYLASRPLDH